MAIGQSPGPHCGSNYKNAESYISHNATRWYHMVSSINSEADVGNNLIPEGYKVQKARIQVLAGLAIVCTSLAFANNTNRDR